MATATIKRRSALTGVLTAPLGGSAETDQAIQGRILGTATTTRRRTAAENAAIAEFDKNILPGLSEHAPTIINNAPAPTASEMRGFGSYRNPAAATPEIRRAQPVSPVNRTDGLGGGVSGSAGVSALSQATRPVGEPSPQVPQPVSTAPTPTGPPAPVGLASPSYKPTVESPSPIPVTTYHAPGEPVPSSVPSAPVPVATPGATPSSTPSAVPTPGRSTEAGVSNSQAAQFTQPTKASPIPETPTSPILDVNEFDKKGKRPFAGF